MKTLLSIFTSLCLFSACNSQPSGTPAAVTKATTGFAVVELFTSQGCSSCPSADETLGKEIAAAKKNGQQLIALSFHVDYWDRLGWKDPFSQHQFTQRQYGYSAKLKGNGVYTPQAIVNGQQALVGSRQAQLEGFIKQGIAEVPEASIRISSVDEKDSMLKIEYQYTGATADLNMAVVQRQISTPIKAGENDGRTLTNYNVVRSWKIVDAKTGSQSAEIEMPAGYKAGDYSVILFAQEKGNGKVLAAAIQ